MLGKKKGLLSFVVLVSLLATAAFAAVILPVVLFLNLNGTVYNDSGVPLNGATVSVITSTPNCFFGNGATTTTTDASGHYALTPRLDIWRSDLFCQLNLQAQYPGLQTGTQIVNVQATPMQNGQTYPVTQNFNLVDLLSPPIIVPAVNPASPATYLSTQVYSFSATVTDNRGISVVYLNFDGTTYTYTNDGVANDNLLVSGNVYYIEFTGLPADMYSYTWSATDIDGNSASVGPTNYIVNRAASSLAFTVNPVSPITYGTATTAICTVGNLEQTLTIERDGVDITTENGVAVTLDADQYDYKCSVPQSANYNAQEILVNDYTVNKAIPQIHLSINGAESDLTMTYGPDVTALGWVTLGDAGAGTRLERDSLVVSNPETINLAADTYTYEYFYEESANYEGLSVVRTVTINQATPVLNMNANPGWSITYPQTVTVTANENNAGDDDLVYYFERDGSDISLENGVAVQLAANVAGYAYEYRTDGGENYTAATVSQTLIISKATPVLGFSANPGWIVAYPTSIIVNGLDFNDGDSDVTYELIRDGSTVTNPDTVTDVGVYNYEFTSTEGENYTAGSITTVAEITKGTPVLTLNLNPASPITYGTQTTATCSVDNAEQTPILYRDGADVSTDNGVAVTLDADTYSYSCEVLESTNYFAANTVTPAYVVDRAIVGIGPGGAIHLSLNGAESDLTVTYPTVTTAIGWKDFSDGTLTLYLDGTDVGSLTDVQTLPVGIYEYSITLTGATNYNDATFARSLIVSDGSGPIITITSPLGNTMSEAWLNATTNEPATCYFGTSTNPTDPMNSVVTDHSTYLTGLPLGSNIYYVRCADAFGNEAETSVTWTVLDSYDIDLVMGWNLISVPVIPTNPILTSDATIWGTNYIIQHYDVQTDTWYEYDSNNAGAATLAQVVPDQGYWINVDSDRTVSFIGDAPGQRAVELFTGSNMIGWTSLTAKRMDLALWFIIDNVTGVECQDTTDVSVKLLRTCNIATESFEPGKGYFVGITDYTSWEYPRNIPPVANAGSDQTVDEGDTVTLDGSASYDLDGTIVSYVWTLGSSTETGTTVSFDMDSVGTYVIELNVTDNQGASAIDQVTVTVNSKPSGPSGPTGGGGPIGSASDMPGGFISIKLTAPDTVTVSQGKPVTFQATVENTGQVDVYDIVLTSNPAWIKINPTSVSTLKKSTTTTFDITVDIPAGTIGSNFMTLTAHGTHPNATVTSSVTVEIRGNPEQCASCAQPTAWTTCNVNGTQTRTVSTCDEESNYACIPTTETRNCGGITGYFIFFSENPVASLFVIFLMILAAVLFYLYRKGKLKGLTKIFGAAKPAATQTPATTQQGIDFNVEYKK